MYNNKKIVVSLTSWPKRIENVTKVVFSILRQSIKPDSVELNLAIEEFPNKENDLPEELIVLQKNNLLEINWVEKNTKVFKKFIPVLQKYYNEKNFYILTIDDDFLYKFNYIEHMIKSLGNADCYSLYMDDIHGCSTIYLSKIFKKDFWTKITANMIKYGISDYYIQQYIKKNNGKFSNAKHFPLKDFLLEYNAVFPNSLCGYGNGKYDKNRVKQAFIEIDKVLSF